MCPIELYSGKDAEGRAEGNGVPAAPQRHREKIRVQNFFRWSWQTMEQSLQIRIYLNTEKMGIAEQGCITANHVDPIRKVLWKRIMGTFAMYFQKEVHLIG